jgi:acyl carrier protein
VEARVNPARHGENPIFRTVAIIVSSISGRVIQQIHRGTPWRDLGVDEIKFGEIVTACEREYGVSIPESDADGSRNPDELASAIFKKLQRAA